MIHHAHGAAAQLPHDLVSPDAIHSVLVIAHGRVLPYDENVSYPEDDALRRSRVLHFRRGPRRYNPALWSGMKYRMIGPNRGGRVTAVTGVPSQPYTFYMGSTGGGVWKTTDAGHTWRTSPTAIFPSRPSARSRSRSPIPTSSMSARARRRSAATSRSAAACISRPTRARHGTSPACATPARSPPCACIPPIPISSTWPRWAIPSRPIPTAAFPQQGRRQDVEEGASTFPNRRRGRSRNSARQPQRALRLHVARRAQALDHHQRRARGRHLQEHRWRRHTGTSSPAGCPTNFSDAPTSPSPPPSPIASTR